jgi:DNA repair exonuclease SbcCD ATPase subunit
MNVVFNKIMLHNFLSFGDAEIELNNRGYVFVQGVNENPNDNSLSNGAGKSSIWDAISYALTGVTIRGTKDVVNIHTDDGAFVALDMDVDGKNFKILRSKNHSKYKTNLLIYIDGKNVSGKGIRDSDALLQQYLPDLTASLLGSVIILGQGLPQRFTNNTPSGRKEVLEKLSKSDFMIEDLKNRIAKRKQQLSQKIREEEDKILSLQSEKTIYEKQLKSNQDLLNTMSPPEAYDNAIEELQTKLNNIEKSVQELEIEISSTSSKQSDLLVNYNSIVSEQNAELQQVDIKYSSELKELNDAKSDNTSKGYALKQEITKMEAIKDVCPTCGQKLPNVSKPDTSKMREEMLLYANTVKELNVKISNVEEKVKAEKTTISLNFKVRQNALSTEMQNNKATVDRLNTSMRDLLKEKTATSTRLVELKGYKEQYNNKKAIYEANIKDAEQKIKEIQEKLLYNNTKEVLTEHSKIIDKFDTIIKRDFRGYLLSNVISFIDAKAKEYSQYIFETDKISFVLDGNNINISYDGKEYDNLSGGERQKVDIIIQLSIRDMLCKYLNFSSNILVLDEIVDFLDATGCDKIMNLINTRLNDINSIYFISHHTDLGFSYDSVLTVVKDVNGISSIKNY